VLLMGFAYKGRPPTDDVRGAPVLGILPVLRAQGLELLGHDFLVEPQHLRSLGVTPTSIEDGFSSSDGVLVITDHPDYARLDFARLLPRLRKPAVFLITGDSFEETVAPKRVFATRN
jgi:UDP-N-acetyl-D-mannosaminuronic acid dehydrogenase